MNSRFCYLRSKENRLIQWLRVSHIIQLTVFRRRGIISCGNRYVLMSRVSLFVIYLLDWISLAGEIQGNIIHTTALKTVMSIPFK